MTTTSYDALEPFLWLHILEYLDFHFDKPTRMTLVSKKLLHIMNCYYPRIHLDEQTGQCKTAISSKEVFQGIVVTAAQQDTGFSSSWSGKPKPNYFAMKWNQRLALPTLKHISHLKLAMRRGDSLLEMKPGLASLPMQHFDLVNYCSFGSYKDRKSCLFEPLCSLLLNSWSNSIKSLDLLLTFYYALSQNSPDQDSDDNLLWLDIDFIRALGKCTKLEYLSIEDAMSSILNPIEFTQQICKLKYLQTLKLTGLTVAAHYNKLFNSGAVSNKEDDDDEENNEQKSLEFKTKLPKYLKEALGRRHGTKGNYYYSYSYYSDDEDEEEEEEDNADEKYAEAKAAAQKEQDEIIALYNSQCAQSNEGSAIFAIDFEAIFKACSQLRSLRLEVCQNNGYNGTLMKALVWKSQNQNRSNCLKKIFLDHVDDAFIDTLCNEILSSSSSPTATSCYGLNKSLQSLKLDKNSSFSADRFSLLVSALKCCSNLQAVTIRDLNKDQQLELMNQLRQSCPRIKKIEFMLY